MADAGIAGDCAESFDEFNEHLARNSKPSLFQIIVADGYHLLLRRGSEKVTRRAASRHLDLRLAACPLGFREPRSLSMAAMNFSPSTPLRRPRDARPPSTRERSSL